MNDNDIPRLRMQHPGEVAELIPYLVGFTPEESLVVIVTRNGRVEVTARADLDGIQQPGATEDLLDRIWSRFPDSDAFLVAYTEDHTAGWNTLHRADAHLAGLADRQTMLVDGDTWELPDGETGTIDPAGQIATQAANYGLKLRPSRSDLQAAFASAPDSDQLAGRVGAVLDTLPRPRDTEAILRLTADLLHRHLPEPADDPRQAAAHVPLDDAIKLAVLAQNPSAQSFAVLSITRDNAPEHLALWRDVVNQVPEYGAEAPLYLAGMAAWVSGDGASAVVALDRSVDLSRGEQPTGQVRLLSQLIDQVVPPSTWEAIREDVLASADHRVRTAIHNSTPEPEAWETVTPTPIRNPEMPVVPPPSPGIAI